LASIINASNSGFGGIVSTGDSSGELKLQTAGTTALTIDTSQNVSLTGTLAMASSFMRNRIINGDMVIDQRNAGASVTPANGGADYIYTLDRWRVFSSFSSKFSVQQNAASVTPPVGFSNYLGITSLAATSVGSTDLYLLSQRIEGFNFADLNWGTANAQTVTLSFRVRSSLTGTFGGALQNSAVNRTYPFTYTISSANTWTTISVTIAGDTSGTWVGATNGAGCAIQFSLGAGSTYSGTAGSWSANTYFSATGATSVVATNGATFYITGVQLEVGSTATPFERRLYNQELANCQRYYWEMARGSLSSNATNSWMGEGGFYSTSQYNLPVMFPVTMRTSPTLNVSNTSAYFGLDTPTAQTFATFAIFQPSIYGTLIYATGLSGGTAGYACSAFTRNAAAFCAFSAEL